MTAISIRDFRAMRPRRSARLLAYNEAQIADDVKLWSGEIRPFLSALAVDTPSKVGTKLTIFRWASTAGGEASGSVVANRAEQQQAGLICS